MIFCRYESMLVACKVCVSVSVCLHFTVTDHSWLLVYIPLHPRHICFNFLIINCITFAFTQPFLPYACSQLTFAVTSASAQLQSISRHHRHRKVSCLRQSHLASFSAFHLARISQTSHISMMPAMVTLPPCPGPPPNRPLPPVPKQ